MIGRPPLLRHTNAQVLLRLLRATGPCSKADLVRASGLSAPTVTNVVAHLSAAGLIEPIGEGDSTGGRPPDILRFRAERGSVGGVEIGTDFIVFLLTDLDGREFARSKIALPRSASTPPEVCALIGSEIRILLGKHSQPGDHLLGLVVGVPAIVDVKGGLVTAFTALQDWRSVPLGSMLEKEMKCHVTVENDTNLGAQGEAYRGAAQGEKNFVFITIGEGVGAGIFIGGKVYRGSQWSAGEIGYMRVPNISRDRPSVHEHGRLEKVLGAPGILKSWRAGRNAARSHPKVDRASAVFDLAAAGNAQAKKILNQRASILADIVLDLALILNPSVVLLAGEVGSHPRLLQEVRTLLVGNEVAVVEVKLGALGPSAVLWGAIQTALESTILGLLQPANLAV
ncbi:MAG: ROK family transcriptional regulator [Candidatus Sulfotelmatobacter sp.]